MSDRQRALATVHIAKRSLGMDTVEYREFLQEQTGKNSAADFNPVEMRKIIEALKERGFAPISPKRENRGHPARKESPVETGGERPRYIRLIKRLWHQISRSPNEQASLRRFIFKYCKPKTELESLEVHELKDLFERLRSFGGVRW